MESTRRRPRSWNGRKLSPSHVRPDVTHHENEKHDVRHGGEGPGDTRPGSDDGDEPEEQADAHPILKAPPSFAFPSGHNLLHSRSKMSSPTRPLLEPPYDAKRDERGPRNTNGQPDLAQHHGHADRRGHQQRCRRGQAFDSITGTVS